MSVEVEVIDFIGTLEKISLEDNVQNKYQDQGQEEDQSQIEDTQTEKVNVEHQDLPIEWRNAKDHLI